MPEVCLSFVLLIPIFIIVATQKLVLQQYKNVQAKFTENLTPHTPFLYSISPWFKPKTWLYIKKGVHTAENGLSGFK